MIFNVSADPAKQTVHKKEINYKNMYNNKEVNFNSSFFALQFWLQLQSENAQYYFAVTILQTKCFVIRIYIFVDTI